MSYHPEIHTCELCAHTGPNVQAKYSHYDKSTDTSTPVYMCADADACQQRMKNKSKKGNGHK